MILVKLVEPWVMQDDPCGVHCVNWEARGATGASGGTGGACEGTLVRAPTRYVPWSSHGHCHHATIKPVITAAEAAGAEESEPAEAAPSPDIRPVRAVP